MKIVPRKSLMDDIRVKKEEEEERSQEYVMLDNY